MSFSQPPTFKVGLTSEEKQLYSQLFKALDTENTGIVSGEKARSTFEKSGLPPTILGEIWQIADHNNLGFLTQFGFCLAMRLIGQTQGGNHPTVQLCEVPGPLPKFVGLVLPQQFATQAGARVASPAQGQRPILQQQPSSGSFMSGHLQQQSPQPPQPLSQQNTYQGDIILPISYPDFQKFSQLFLKTVGNAAELGGHQAKDIFLKAELPTQTLGQIWNLVDKDNVGSLNISSFVVAMHLIHGVLSGSVRQLPTILPDAVWNSVNQYASTLNTSSAPVASVAPPPPAGLAPQPQAVGSPRQSSFANSISSQQTTVRHPQSPPGSRDPSVSNPWQISPTLRQQYEAIFENLDKAKSGILNSEQVASVLMSSKLSQEDLATVWDLSDIQNTGNFTKLEFVIALFLVNRRLSGESLPNIVPDALIASIKQQQQSPQQQTASTLPISSRAAATVTPSPAPVPPKKAATHMEDLVDIFGSSNASPVQSTTLSTPSVTGNAGTLRTPTSTGFGNGSPATARVEYQSELTPTSTGNLPRVRKNMTGSFKPTSTFGQSLLSKQPLESPREVQETEDLIQDVATLPAPQPTAVPDIQQAKQVDPVQKQHTVNYDALRSVPPPPPPPVKAVTQELPSRQFAASPQQFQQQPAQGQSRSTNNDLLADTNPEVSGQLSQATSDIANVSNQIKSLAGQTSGLQEKKIRAEQELAKILALKQEIEGKLKSLKSSYDNEVKQVDQVEANLVTAKEETEALRSESSISEAKFNHLSNELNEKQIAMEELQKQNSTLKEKLGFLNAEILELEKQNDLLTSENQRLTNQLNVKNSQVQVVIVKNQELKSSITELEESNRKLSEEYRQVEENERRLDEEHKLLMQRYLDAQKSKPAPPPQSKQREPIPSIPTPVSNPVESSKKGLSSGVIAGSAAAAAAVVGAVGASGFLSSHSDKKEKAEVKKSVDGKAPTEPELPAYDESIPSASSDSQKVVEPVSKAIEQSAVAIDDSTNDLFSQSGSEIVSKDVEPISHKEIESTSHREIESTSHREVEPISHKEVNVDENETSVSSEEFVSSTSKHIANEEQASGQDNTLLLNDSSKKEQVLPGSFVRPDESIAGISTASDFQEEGDESETPVTSPNNSDFQFPQGTNAGIAGGLVGLPSVLVGLQRTDSLTSSVQNNAALSVRDDNMDGISDRETLEIPNSEDVNTTANEIPHPPSSRVSEQSHEDIHSGEKVSSGESFEMVNSGDVPGLFASKAPASTGANFEDEFPPIRELDIEESDSEDESENFVDTVEKLTSEQHPDPTINFDDAFDDLEPASNEATTSAAPHFPPVNKEEDLFGDEFEDLQEAAPDKTFDEFAMDNTFDFSETFTAQEQEKGSEFPDIGPAPTNGGSDEWEELFAGFGNAASAASPVPALVATIDAPFGTPGAAIPSHVGPTGQQNELVQELCGMGFDEKTAVDALEREGWNLQAAINFLLDHA